MFGGRPPPFDGGGVGTGGGAPVYVAGGGIAPG